MPSTVTAAVLNGATSSAPPDDKRRVLFSSPTLEALPESHLGSVVGGAVGGALFLLLVLSLGGVCYLRKQQTFRGNYYTKQYMGAADLQKAPAQHELHPTKTDHDREEWGGRETGRYGDRGGGEKQYSPHNGHTRAIRESGHRKNHHGGHRDHRDQQRVRDHLRHPGPPHPTGLAGHARYPSPPKALANGSSPYLSDDCYDSGPEGDYVSHMDGSVISRREWYV